MKKEKNKNAKNIDEEINRLNRIISKQNKTINKLIRDDDKWRINFKESLSAYDALNNSLKETKNELQAVLNSRFWTISEPIRNFLDMIKGKQNKKLNEISTIEYATKKTRYDLWIEENERIQSENITFKYNPLISIIIYSNDNLENYSHTHDSLEAQIYKNYEILSPNSIDSIKNIPDYLNKQLDKSKGDYYLFIKSGDILSINALYDLVHTLNTNPKLNFIYSDEDVINLNTGNRNNPFFKPDYSPDTLKEFFYIGQLSLFKKDKMIYFDTTIEDNLLYDYALNYLNNINSEDIFHINRILYHNHTDYYDSFASSNSIKNKYLAQMNIDGKVLDNHIVYGNSGEKISIIIPSKDNFEVLKVCVDSIIKKTDYKNYEIIVVDNGSNENNKTIIGNYLKDNNCAYYHDVYPFNFSYMCNYGAKKSNGEYLLFLNDDTEVIQDDWLEIMLGYARLKHIGAVGVKLLYPNSNLIQHCGVSNYYFGPGHYFKKMDDSKNHYFYRNKANYNVLSVTAACMMINKNEFYEIGCFNEDLPNNYNDADLCFKLHDCGYYNIILNNVVLYHHESISRGDSTLVGERMKKHLKEKNKLYELNPKYICYDPFYNDNLTQENDSFDIEIF